MFLGKIMGEKLGEGGWGHKNFLLVFSFQNMYRLFAEIRMEVSEKVMSGFREKALRTDVRTDRHDS